MKTTDSSCGSPLELPVSDPSYNVIWDNSIDQKRKLIHWKKIQFKIKYRLSVKLRTFSSPSNIMEIVKLIKGELENICMNWNETSQLKLQFDQMDEGA